MRLEGKGAIETEMNADLLADERAKRALLSQIPLGRMGTPRDVASIAAFLASADADYVTGSTYFADGGLAVHYEEQ
jgi:glucose 1-dehydrogenase